MNSDDLPNAHIHIHAHRDEIVWLKGARQTNDNLKPLLSDVHFPVGGDRFRPCFEDFLAFIIKEFNVKTKPGYKKVLNDGRLIWRETQLKAAVRDNPFVAASALLDMGHIEGDIEPIRGYERINKLHAL